MTATVQIVKGLKTADLPTDASFFDLYDGETLVAHVSRPRTYDPDRRWTVVLYDARRQVVGHRLTYFPMSCARIHMRAMRDAKPEQEQDQ